MNKVKIVTVHRTFQHGIFVCISLISKQHIDFFQLIKNKKKPECYFKVSTKTVNGLKIQISFSLQIKRRLLKYNSIAMENVLQVKASYKHMKSIHSNVRFNRIVVDKII